MDANMREAERWLRQGERDLVSARNSCRTGDFEWACFQAQQSAEKSLKALLYARGFRKILTHSVYELIREISTFEPSFQTLKSEAKVLDSAYIMTRCPDSIVGNLTPSEYYDQEDAKECVSSRGFDLQCRETIALRVIGQIRDLAREIRSRRRVSTIILYGSFARGDFHEASDIDLVVVGDFRERFHKAGRQPSSISPTSRLNRSATPTKSSLNWSGRRTPSSTRRWPKASGSSGAFHLIFHVASHQLTRRARRREVRIPPPTGTLRDLRGFA